MKKFNILNIVKVLILIMFFTFIIVPFIMIIFTALKDPTEIIDMPNRTIIHRIFPDSFTNAENIIKVWTGTASQLNGVPFYRFLINSAIVTLGSMVPSIILSLTSAYGFARYKFFGKNVMFYMFLGLVMVPMEMISIPLFLIMTKLRLVNTYAGLMVPGIISAFGTFLLKEAFSPIPSSYIESGRIDGASEWTIFSRIMTPMIQSSIVTFIVIKLTWSWNEFFWPLLMVSEEKMKTLTLGLSKFSNDLFKEYTQINAAVLISIFPLFILFIFCNKYIKAGLMHTGVKG